MAVLLALGVLLGACLVNFAFFRHKTYTAQVPGPPSSSWFFGHISDLAISPTWGIREFDWQKHYGTVYRIKGCFGSDRLVVSDPRALQYLLTSGAFGRSRSLRHAVDALFGEGSVIALQGEAHRRARAIMNPAFSAGAIRKLQPLFERTAAMLTSNLEESLIQTSEIDMSPPLVTATMSAITEGVFGHPLQALDEELVENHRQLYTVFGTRTRAHLVADALMHYVPPFLLSLAFRRTEAAAALRTSERLTHDFGTRVIHERLEAEHEGLEVAQNLFSTFMQLDASEKGKQLLDSDEVVAQTAVLLLGGQDTTANTLAFGLRELAKHPDVQDQLRAEIHSSLGSNSGIVYDNLPLLNAFIKETLRMYPAEPISETMALEDTILPLTYGLATTSGEHITKLPIRKGELVLMALGSYQRLESIWGPDAHEFKPTRWFEGSPNVLHIGPYANLLSFYAGPRTCLGWRFAVMEMQVLTCELLSKFSFALPENDSVRPRVAVTLMPITGSGKKGSPMVVTRLL